MLRLPAEEIHLWFCRPSDLLLDSDYLQQLLTTLDARELQRMRRFRFERHRRQFCTSHALTRWALSRYADVSPEQWRFEYNNHGKPFVSNPGHEKLQFSLSHTDGLQLLAVRHQFPVGVDVELRKKRVAGADIAGRFFSSAEVAEFLSAAPEEQQNIFFDYWTLKESYIKACGKGLAIPLRHFSYSILQQGKIRISFAPEREDSPADWRFWLLAVGQDHACALAAGGMQQAPPIARLRFWETVPMREMREFSARVLQQSN